MPPEELRQELEHDKTSKLLNDSTVLKCVTEKWIKVDDLSSDQYSVDKKRFKNSMLRSDLCDFNDPYIVVKGRIILLKEIMILKLEIKS